MKPSRYAWLLVALLWVVALLNYVDRQIIFSVLPLVKADLKLTDTQLGLLSTVFLWVYGILSPVAGYLGDRFGRVRVILISLAVWSLVTWGTGHARTISELLLARGLMGVSEAFYLPAALALIADYHDDRSRSSATGLHFSGIYVGIVLGGLGGGWMGELFGWRYAFTILGIAGVAYMGVLMLFLRERTAPALRGDVRPPQFLQSFRELFRLRGLATLTLVFSMASIANWIVYGWLPLYLYEGFGMSLTAAGFAGTFYIQAGSVVGILVGGRMADSLSRRSGSGRLLTQAAGLAAAAPFLFLVGSAGSLSFIIAGLVVFGVGRGMYDCNVMPVLCQIARPELRASGYGIFNCLGCLAGGLMTAVAGGLKSAVGLGVSFQLAAALLVVSAIVLSRLRLEPEPAAQAAEAGA